MVGVIWNSFVCAEEVCGLGHQRYARIWSAVLAMDKRCQGVRPAGWREAAAVEQRGRAWMVVLPLCLSVPVS